MPILIPPINNLGDSNVFFMHNWRCAGSTLNSFFSSNFGDNYLKIGTQFSHFGWPLYGEPERKSLSDIKPHLKSGSILGGHLCLGVQSFVPGCWDLWINARNPIDRLSSGIKRFHAKAFSLPPGNYKKSYVRKRALLALDELMKGPLRHEMNGVAKRLAGFSVIPSLQLDLNADLEAISCFEFEGDELDYLLPSRSALQDVKVIILQKYLHASLICIEKKYSLSPLINLFSDGRHNSASLSKATSSELQSFSLVQNELRRYCECDISLWQDICTLFSNQLAECAVSKKDVLIREILHETPFLNVEWFSSGNFGDDQLVQIIAKQLAFVGSKNHEIYDDIVSVATSWSRFDPDSADKIRYLAMSLKN